jgi:hypothetical protein
MNMMKWLVGGSLVVVGLGVVVGGTWDVFTKPIVFGVNALQIAGVVTALLGVATLVGYDPMRLKRVVIMPAH